MSKTSSRGTAATATVGFEATLWAAADALRGSMDAAEYKHVVLGLIFLKYISDAFDEQHAKLFAATASGADPEDPDEYRALSIFWVPPEARWQHLKAQARQPTIGQLVDDAMAGIERDNPALKGVLPKDYARPALDKTRLGQLIDMISNIKVGDEASRAKDVLGRVYEYFLSQFARYAATTSASGRGASCVGASKCSRMMMAAACSASVRSRCLVDFEIRWPRRSRHPDPPAHRNRWAGRDIRTRWPGRTCPTRPARVR